MKMSNISNISNLVVSIVDDGESAKSGPYTIIKKCETDIADLSQRVKYVFEQGGSVRGTIVDFFASQPDGEKLLEAYNDAKGRNKSIAAKTKAIALRKRIESVNMLLQRTCEIYDVLQRLTVANFRWQIRSVIGSNVVCYVWGSHEAELDAKPYSVEALRRLGQQDFSNRTTVAEISAEKPKSANNKKGDNGEKIMPSKLGDTVKSLDTTLAAYDLPQWKNNGISQMGKSALMRLYAQLERNLPRDVKIKALEEYDANAAPTIKAADAA
jgi:hypothetical protein